MRAALAAARAEIEAEKSGVVQASDLKKKAPVPNAVAAAPVPLKFTADLINAPAPQKKKKLKKVEELPPGLDAATESKLKLLRRLNPSKSYKELLEQISPEDKAAVSGDASSKKKRRWF